MNPPPPKTPLGKGGHIVSPPYQGGKFCEALERPPGAEPPLKLRNPTPARNGLRVHLRYLRFLLGEFRLALAVFAGVVVVGGVILHNFYRHEAVSLPKAFYSVFLMVFLESGLEFPDEWYLQPMFFLVPVLGLGALADSVVRLAYLMFTQKRKLPEWQRMAASLYRNHVVVVGVGRVGYRVILGLLEMKEQVVAIESGASANFVDDVLDLGVPVIQGNGRLEKVLAQAGVAHARAVILATSDDLTNIDAGLTARDLNPKANIVLRLFDESLARKITGAFAMPAICTASVAAPPSSPRPPTARSTRRSSFPARKSTSPTWSSTRKGRSSARPSARSRPRP